MSYDPKDPSVSPKLTWSCPENPVFFQENSHKEKYFLPISDFEKGKTYTFFLTVSKAGKEDQTTSFETTISIDTQSRIFFKLVIDKKSDLNNGESKNILSTLRAQEYKTANLTWIVSLPESRNEPIYKVETSLVSFNLQTKRLNLNHSVTEIFVALSASVNDMFGEAEQLLTINHGPENVNIQIEEECISFSWLPVSLEITGDDDTPFEVYFYVKFPDDPETGEVFTPVMVGYGEMLLFSEFILEPGSSTLIADVYDSKGALTTSSVQVFCQENPDFSVEDLTDFFSSDLDPVQSLYFFNLAQRQGFEIENGPGTINQIINHLQEEIEIQQAANILTKITTQNEEFKPFVGEMINMALEKVSNPSKATLSQVLDSLSLVKDFSDVPSYYEDVLLKTAERLLNKQKENSDGTFSIDSKEFTLNTKRMDFEGIQTEEDIAQESKHSMSSGFSVGVDYFEGNQKAEVIFYEMRNNEEDDQNTSSNTTISYFPTTGLFLLLAEDTQKAPALNISFDVPNDLLVLPQIVNKSLVLSDGSFECISRNSSGLNWTDFGCFPLMTNTSNGSVRVSCQCNHTTEFSLKFKDHIAASISKTNLPNLTKPSSILQFDFKQSIVVYSLGTLFLFMLVMIPCGNSLDTRSKLTPDNSSARRNEQINIRSPEQVQGMRREDAEILQRNSHFGNLVVICCWVNLPLVSQPL